MSAIVDDHATTAAKTVQTVEKPNRVNVWMIDVCFLLFGDVDHGRRFEARQSLGWASMSLPMAARHVDRFLPEIAKHLCSLHVPFFAVLPAT